jgi:tRNA-2-methylthio-N6-dimethylallyladenosine synthase
VPNVSITADILVGYPGESEADFQATLDIIREVGYAGLFSFKYSVRPGTASSKLEDSIPEKEKLRRLDLVIKLGQKMAEKFSKSLVGTIQDVLVEGVSFKNEEKMRGRSGSGRIVEFEGSLDLIGSIVDVKIDSCTTWTLTGHTIL